MDNNYVLYTDVRDLRHFDHKNSIVIKNIAAKKTSFVKVHVNAAGKLTCPKFCIITRLVWMCCWRCSALDLAQDLAEDCLHKWIDTRDWPTDFCYFDVHWLMINLYEMTTTTSLSYRKLKNSKKQKTLIQTRYYF